jgi:hypothetical protein
VKEEIMPGGRRPKGDYVPMNVYDLNPELKRPDQDEDKSDKDDDRDKDRDDD